jgi:peptidoglycan hydrolase-like protein with peptidoglycan-binding domain
MKSLIAFVTIAAFLAAVPAFAGNAVSDMHPEEAYPDDAPALVSPGPYVEVIRQVQEKLHELDFDPGPVNGASSSKLQAALAQFQLSEALPVSGMLDQRTLLALGLDPADLVTDQPDAAGREDAAAGGSAD